MERVEITFDAALHSGDAIQRAAYRFCDRVSLELRRDTDVFTCTLQILDETPDAAALIADFRTEVLDQVLRERIRSETAASRNLILALAFSKTDLISD